MATIYRRSRLVEAGVSLVQVNLGNNETWDQHGDIFPRLKDKLFPPTDRALSALLDDLYDTGMLDRTLIVVGSEFGRTPKLNGFEGRDHWPHGFSVALAGGGQGRTPMIAKRMRDFVPARDLELARRTRSRTRASTARSFASGRPCIRNFRSCRASSGSR